MTINRQKFLAELGKLLTFMYEEDRQLALSIYERMFDAAEDEQVIIQRLISPTKQAVMVARAYDAKERRLSVSSSSKDEDGYHQDEEETPQFVLVINRVFEEIFPDRTPAQEMVEDQISFFDAAADEEGSRPVSEAAEDPEEEITYQAEDILAEMKALAAEEAGAHSVEEVPQPEEPERIAEDAEEEPAASEEETEAAENKEEEPAASDEEPVPETEEEAQEPPEEPEEETGVRETDSEPEFPESETEEEAEPETVPAAEKAHLKKRGEADAPLTKTVTNVPLLILFLLIAIPVTLALVLLLLIPTACSFALAAGAIALGVTLIMAAFGGFAVLADILVLVGTAVIFLALGLLFLWLGIWLIGGGIVGLIRGVSELGRRWCRKEVPTE
ncbi:MAG: hypothetical protein IJQ02_12165 [Oscillospiraceae bacterium]|nr:hypothetical protein [Oscillospiraceae bacterium]